MLNIIIVIFIVGVAIYLLGDWDHPSLFSGKPEVTATKCQLKVFICISLT